MLALPVSEIGQRFGAPLGFTLEPYDNTLRIDTIFVLIF